VVHYFYKEQNNMTRATGYECKEIPTKPVCGRSQSDACVHLIQLLLEGVFHCSAPDVAFGGSSRKGLRGHDDDEVREYDALVHVSPRVEMLSALENLLLQTLFVPGY
jgi:hypothetical protein